MPWCHKINEIGIPKPIINDKRYGSFFFEIINPIIDKLNKEKNEIEGPFSADSFFGMKNYLKYDGVISCYHDQGLIGFKSLFFDEGVNYTGGLPIVRTSPDHGTAHDLVGKNKAIPHSLINCFNLINKINKNRNKFIK